MGLAPFACRLQRTRCAVDGTPRSLHSFTGHTDRARFCSSGASRVLACTLLSSRVVAQTENRFERSELTRPCEELLGGDLPAPDSGRESAQCLSEEQVLAFSEGSLPPAAMDSVNAHLDWCPTCQELVNAAVHDWDHPPMSQPSDRIWMATFGPRQVIAGRYRIERFLGRGGMGEVYAAYDIVLSDHVALKTVLSTNSDNPSAVKRLLSEARLARRISHPNICRVHDVGVHEEPGRIDEPLHFLTMEFIDGKRLAQILRAGPLELAFALRVARQILDGLQAAHRSGVLHRDLKSDNIMVTGSGAAAHSTITDFGLSQALDEHTRAMGGGRQERVGSIAYMAPEQILGHDLGPETDLFGFGVVLFEMLCGRLPFVPEGESPRDMALRRLTERAVPPSHFRAGIPPALEAVVLRCLELGRAERFRSTTEVLAALESVQLDALEAH
jgi:Protein kinase domain